MNPAFGPFPEGSFGVPSSQEGCREHTANPQRERRVNRQASASIRQIDNESGESIVWRPRAYGKSTTRAESQSSGVREHTANRRRERRINRQASASIRQIDNESGELIVRRPRAYGKLTTRAENQSPGVREHTANRQRERKINRRTSKCAYYCDVVSYFLLNSS